MAANQYPLDFDSLTKGQSFSNEQLSEILGISPEKDLTRFRFAVMSVQQMIQHQTGFTVKAGESGLTVLTDAEAAEHNRARFAHHVRGLHSRYELALNVDRELLTPEQRASHDRALMNNGRILQSVIETAKTLTLESTQRPDLLEPPKK